MKKKHLQLKQLKLNKETVLNMSAVKGGAPAPGTADCAVISVAAKCVQTQQADCMDTQGTVMPCCPGCRSGANNTVVKEFCDVIIKTMDCPFIPADPIG